MKIKQLIPLDKKNIILLFSIIFLVPILYGLITFQYKYTEKINSYENTLKNVESGTFKLLKEDISKLLIVLNVINDSHTHNTQLIQLSILPNYLLIKTNELSAKLKFKKIMEGKEGFIGIEKNGYTLLLKIKDLKAVIESNLPKEIIYDIRNIEGSLFTNNTNLATTTNKLLNNELNLASDELRASIGIDQNLYLKAINAIALNVIYEVIFITMLCIVIFVISLKSMKKGIYSSLVTEVEALSNYKDATEKDSQNKSNYLESIKASHKIQQKIYEMIYLKAINESQVILNMYTDEEKPRLERKGKEILDEQESLIDLNEVLTDISKYFAFISYSKKVSINIKATEISIIKIPMAKEAFYQLIFSVLDNKISMLNNNALEILTSIKDGALCFNIEDNGLFLTETEFDEYTQKKGTNRISFILSWKEIKRALDYHSSTMFSERQNKKNILLLEICLNKTANIKNENNVRYIDDFKR